MQIVTQSATASYSLFPPPVLMLPAPPVRLALPEPPRRLLLGAGSALGRPMNSPSPWRSVEEMDAEIAPLVHAIVDDMRQLDALKKGWLQ